MVFKSFKVVTFEQVLGFDDGDSDCEYERIGKCATSHLLLILFPVGGSEFEGLKGGFRMMSLLTLFGGLKNVFKVKKFTTDTVIFRLHYKADYYTWDLEELKVKSHHPKTKRSKSTIIIIPRSYKDQRVESKVIMIDHEDHDPKMIPSLLVAR